MDNNILKKLDTEIEKTIDKISKLNPIENPEEQSALMSKLNQLHRLRIAELNHIKDMEETNIKAEKNAIEKEKLEIEKSKTSIERDKLEIDKEKIDVDKSKITLEQDRIDSEYQFRKAEYEMLEKRFHHDCKIGWLNEILGFVRHMSSLGHNGYWMSRGFQFEETGTITDPFFRMVINHNLKQTNG